MKKIIAIALALVMVVPFSAVAFADGPKGNGPMGSPGMGGQMQMGGGPRGNFGQNGQQPPEMPNGEAPQGGFEQNGQLPPEMPNGDAPQGGFEQNSQQPLEMPSGEAPKGGMNRPTGGPGMGGMNGFDPINAIFEAVNALEDETIKANIEELLQAEFDAIVAERDAEDKEAAAQAVADAREALLSALAEAGIEMNFGASESLPEMPDGQQMPEMPSGENMGPPQGSFGQDDRQPSEAAGE